MEGFCPRERPGPGAEVQERMEKELAGGWFAVTGWSLVKAPEQKVLRVRGDRLRNQWGHSCLRSGVGVAEKHGEDRNANIPDVSLEEIGFLLLTRPDLVLCILGKTSADEVVAQLNHAAAIKQHVGALES